MKLISVIFFCGLSAFALSGCTPIGVMVGGAAIAGVAVAEERSVADAVSDANIKLKILNALIQENESLFVDVSTTVIEGRVLVTGEVPSDADRERANAVIWPISGVKTVINELQISKNGSLNSSANDTWIIAKLKSRLLQDLDIKHVNYSVDTVNSVVYLMGIAQDQTELEQVVLHARDVSGVRRIVSHVVMKDSR